MLRHPHKGICYRCDKQIPQLRERICKQCLYKLNAISVKQEKVRLEQEKQDEINRRETLRQKQNLMRWNKVVKCSQCGEEFINKGMKSCNKCLDKVINSIKNKRESKLFQRGM